MRSRVTPLPVETVTARPLLGRERVTVVLPWDLDPSLSAFPKTPADGQLLVLETKSKIHAMPWHRQKLTLVVSALRHFVQERRAAGFHVEHRVADDYASGITGFSKWAAPREVHVTQPREWAIDERLKTIAGLTTHPDGGPGGHFLIARDGFEHFTAGRKTLRMEHFYPLIRKKFGWLVDAQGRPEGGQWSFDADNRGHARGVTMPPVPWFEPDALTRRVMHWVAQPAIGSWGTLEGFGWPVTRAQSLEWLEAFMRDRLTGFGPYEDAIRSDERFLYHSLLSAPLNLGLLRPEELANAAIERYRQGHASLASTEGFLRQVAGWREFMRGMYWHLMPGLRTANQLEATRPLPDFFWEPERCEMNCLREALTSVRDTGYTHHIQRLMVICNYATLAGLEPHAVSQWFWAGFIDAYEWVELPNVVGMGLFGTGAFTTKPYVASAAYVKRQSGLSAKGRGPSVAKGQAPCVSCRFDPDIRVGPTACPFNSMYWSFLSRHRERLAQNPRMSQLLKNLDRFGPAQRAEIEATAEAHRTALRPGPQGWAFDEDAG